VKKLLLTSIVVFFASYCFAQGVSGGVKAGLNLANQKFSSDGVTVDSKVRPGLHAGLFLTAMINERFAIQPEVLFSMQGSKLDFDAFDYNYDTYFNYLAIPLLARYNITDRISVHAGPQFGFLMSAEIEISDGTQVIKYDVKDDYKTMEISGAIGGEIDIIGGLGGGVRYVFGLSNINEGGIDDNGKAKNSVFQIYLKCRLFGGNK
jgi:Outer membrane protein beta-barrel domain